MEKWTFLDQNHGLTPLKKCQFFAFLTSCFYGLERRFFVLEYRKRHFPSLYCLKKKNWKNDHFWTKTTGKSLWKNVNFSTWWTSCFYGLERCFFYLEDRKGHFPGQYCLKKKKLETGPFLDQDHGLTTLENCPFLDQNDG